MALLGGLLGGGQQPVWGSDPVDAIVLDVVNELKLTCGASAKTPSLSSLIRSLPPRGALPASVSRSLDCAKPLQALPISVINSLNASGSKNAAAYQSALGDIETAVQNALVTVQQRASNSAVAVRAQEQVLDAVGNELVKVITNVDTVVDGMAVDVKGQPRVAGLLGNIDDALQGLVRGIEPLLRGLTQTLSGLVGGLLGGLLGAQPANQGSGGLLGGLLGPPPTNQRSGRPSGGLLGF